jgi:hypothetical protein
LPLLYHICRAAGEQRAADALLRRIVTLHLNSFWATKELTSCLLERGALPRPRSTHAMRCASRRRTRNLTI